jgi:multisubunit Na+/H+ antiporter MnhB subunit
MFEGLNERMKTDEEKVTLRERLNRWVVIILGVAVLLFGGLYIGLHYFRTS